MLGEDGDDDDLNLREFEDDGVHWEEVKRVRNKK